MITSAEAKKKLRTCKLCQHDYLYPCDGKDKACPNKVHLAQVAAMKPAKKK